MPVSGSELFAGSYTSRVRRGVAAKPLPKRLPRRRIDFPARSAALAAMRASLAVSEEEPTTAELANRLAWPRDVLAGHAAVLAERGLSIAYVYAAAASASVERAIAAIAAADGQEGWPTGGMEDFSTSGLAEWL